VAKLPGQKQQPAIRIDPLTLKGVVASVVGVVVLSASLWLYQPGGTPNRYASRAALQAIAMALCWIPFRKQINLAPGRAARCPVHSQVTEPTIGANLLATSRKRPRVPSPAASPCSGRKAPGPPAVGPELAKFTPDEHAENATGPRIHR
jgi:hypothetical protein